MTERRSNRAKSNINYSKYDCDDDDDFADPTPTTRKLKKDKENCHKSVPLKEKLPTNDKKSKSRKAPPEDRLLELQIKEALAASLKETYGNKNGETGVKDGYDSVVIDKPKETSTQKDPDTSRVKNGDEIEIISSTTVSDSPPRKRQKTTSKYNSIDSDSDNDQDSTYAGESDDSDDDEFDPNNNDDDDDFNSHKKPQVGSKKKTNQVNTAKKVSKTPPVLKSTVKTPKSTKSVNKLTPRLSTTPINRTTQATIINTPDSSVLTRTPNSTPSCGTPSSIQRKIPSWTPPGPAGKTSGESCSMKSPGGIRIGLSRQQRVKTLHPSLTVQP